MTIHDVLYGEEMLVRRARWTRLLAKRRVHLKRALRRRGWSGPADTNTDVLILLFLELT